MCGIVGYIGPKDVDSVVLVGLEKLEYRGYDSAGFASIIDGELFIRKKKGRIRELAAILNGIPISSNIGIGHTRWATHGTPTDENAHPHTDCNDYFAIVHNGVIENFRELQKDLKKKKHILRSNTDTEVIAHLLEENYKGDFLEAVVKTVKILKGSFALAILNKEHPDKLIGVRKGSPLIVGIGKNENLIASDIPAILSLTRKIVVMEDGEIVLLKENKVEFYDFNGKRKRKRAVFVEWEEDMIEKRGYPHFMLKEIHEQPRVIEDNLYRMVYDSSIKLNNKKAEKMLMDAEYIIIQAAGTSYHAGLYGKYLFEKYIKVFTECELSSEFRYREILNKKKTIIVGISQSGETADTLAGIRRGKELGFKILSFVNVKGSTIDRESDAVIYLNAGPEIGVASTKAYIAQLFNLLVTALYIGKRKGNLSDREEKEIIKELRNIPDKMRYILGREDEISYIAKKYYNVRNAMFLGRGLLYPTALEGALKLKEISYIHSTGYAAGEMKHGPIALIDKEFPVIAICPKNELYEKMLTNIEEVKAREAPLITIGTEGDKDLKNISDDFIPVPDTHFLLQPLITIIPLQLLAYHIALLRGCDVDKPRNLAKSVTVE